ncbi:MAG: PIG-L family deacetylase [Acidobacteriota bacterium]|nr:PIG-L family deacetylase [Acidobacteriota bacterium]
MRASRIAAAAALLLLLNHLPLPAQLRVRPVGELPNDATLRLALRQLKSTGSFMQTTAHPDDEDNALLAMMSHGRGMRTTLVSATRGDGGQNEIGPEIFQALGVLRTEELQAVHRFDGAEQYFTRAIDFGFSYSIEESLEKWGHQEILGDFVRHIRAIRPDVIAGFLCGGTGGGQHHQASARLTLEAFRAAADPARFPEQVRDGLRPWQAKRVFCTEGFVAPGQPPVAPSRDLLRANGSEFDPVLGRTYDELGLEARSMHKCQGTSQLLLLPGASSFSRIYRLKDTAIGEQGVAPKDIFEGIDTSILGLTRFAGEQIPPALATSLQAVAAIVQAASQALDQRGSEAAAPPLAAGLAALRELRSRLESMGLSDAARYEIDFRLAFKERQFEAALLLTHGIRIEALADDGVVVPGQPLKVSVLVGNNAAAVAVKTVRLAGLDGEPPACAGAVERAGAFTCVAELRVADVPVSTPYWTPRKDAARYDFEAGVSFGVPFRPSPFRATLGLTIAGVDVAVERSVEYRYSDLFAGEKRMELQVVPAFDVRVSPDIAIVPTAAPLRRLRPQVLTRPVVHTRTIEVAIGNNQKGAVSAAVELRLPEGWRAAPASAAVTFARENEQASVRFDVTPPASAAPGEYVVAAAVTTSGGASSSAGYEVVEYPHIRRRHVVQPAQSRVKVIDVRVAQGLRVGYVMGVGDAVPAAMEQLGADVHLITPAELASSDLDRYHVIVTGVRAYERRADLRANNSRLLDYVHNGGTVIVQYNKQEFNEAQYGPYPAKVGTDRVTDENAPVEVMVPAHPVFNTPNKIGPAAWTGWVQERGTYFLGERDAQYVDLLRSTDPFANNPGAKSGALVEARYGKGRWIYVGLGLWRQLPAGTEGAYQLMANLLSLRKR